MSASIEEIVARRQTLRLHGTQSNVGEVVWAWAGIRADMVDICEVYRDGGWGILVRINGLF